MKTLGEYHSPVRISLIFLFWVALMGVLMRSYNLLDWLHPYKHLLHSHSHVAFQGWLYTLIMFLLTKEFISTDRQKQGNYLMQFVLTVGIVFGILISFVLHGYAFYSILFSTLFQLMSYWFFFRFFRDLHPTSDLLKKEIQKWIKWGMVFNIISTFGPWSLAIVSAKGLAQTEWYDSSIYFFLHFQYNGWFSFVAIGLFILFAVQNSISIHHNKLKFARIAFIAATFLGYTHSLLHLSFSNYLSIPSMLGACALVFFLIFFLKAIPVMKLVTSQKLNYLITFAMLALMVKTLMQIASTMPVFENLAFRNRDMVMFYMHWTLIGWISFFFLGYLNDKHYFVDKQKFVLASGIMLIGFLGSEIVLLFSALSERTDSFTMLINGCSILMLLGITALALLVRRK